MSELEQRVRLIADVCQYDGDSKLLFQAADRIAELEAELEKLKAGGPGIPELTDSGMDLRDYFAAHALPKVIAQIGTTGWQDQAAWAAYSLADAMIRQRETTPKEQQK